MGQSDFYRFEPEEPLATYGLARAALQFLTDNYWKNIGDEARKALVLPGSFPERNFHYSLMQATNGTKIALERWPEDSQLLKLLPIFERSLKRIGHTESLAIQLLYGEDLVRLHSNIGDYAAGEFLQEARVMLDGLIDTGDKSFTGGLYLAYGAYQVHVEELVKLYDGKREQLDSRTSDGSGTQGKRKRYRLHELYERQEERYQELWLNGLMDGQDYNLPRNGV